MKTNFLGFVLCLFFLSNNLHAQNEYIPKVIPPSPNASALMKFTDVPVSAYTGTSDVSVPIYTIQTRDVTVPITLDYHTGGIRLKEEAGWVGLGWALNYGGMISRTIMGEDDFNSTKYFNSTVPQLFGDIAPQDPGFIHPTSPSNYFLDFFCNDNVRTTQGTEDLAPLLGTNPSPYDAEPDIYSYSFPGHSGKFIITRDRKIILQKQENILIQFQSDGSSFTITDDQGTKYIFNDIEYTESSTGTGEAKSSWCLSKIVSKQNDTVTFTYQIDDNWISVAADFNDTYDAYTYNNDGYNRYNSAGTDYINQTLKTIDFNNGQIQFSFTGNRADLKYGKELNYIKIYQKDAAGNLNYLKQDSLYYSYFNHGQTSGTNYEFERLRLDSIKEISGSLSAPPYSFSYTNVPTNIQSYSAKHSCSIDHWGYFNGASNIKLIPYMSFNPSQNLPYTFAQRGVNLSIPFTYSTDAANRDPDINYATTFALTKVVYPGGGKTMFEYELNKYNKQASITGSQSFPYKTSVDVSAQMTNQNNGTAKETTGTIDLSKIDPILPQGATTTNATLTVTFRGGAKFRNIQYPLGTIYFDLIGPGGSNVYNHEDIRSDDLSCQNNDCYIITRTNIPISVIGGSVVLNWKAHIGVADDDFQGIYATLYWKEDETIYNDNQTLNAGGLRIKSLADYTNNKLVKQRLYNYDYSPGNSSGKLMSFPTYARYGTQYLGGSTLLFISLFGSSNTSLTSVMQGNIVGYSQVTESTIDPTNSNDNGKTVYSYFNSSDTVIDYRGFAFPGMLNIGNSLNGSLLYKIDYANKGSYYQKVDSIENYYRTTNRAILYSCKYQFTGATGLDPNLCSGGTIVSDEVFGCMYPSIKSERILLDSTVNITYDQTDTSKLIKNVKRYFYDNPAHYLPTRTITTNSKGELSITKNTYPLDYTVTGTPNNNTAKGVQDLQNLHIINPVIEQYIQRSNSDGTNLRTIAGSFTTYKPDAPLADIVYNLETAQQITNFQPGTITSSAFTMDSRYKPRVYFDTYDGSGNIIQYHKLNDLYHSYVWGYNNTLPIAETVNATSNQIYHTSFEEGAKGDNIHWDANMDYDNTHVHSGNRSGWIHDPNTGELFSHSQQKLSVNLTSAKSYHYSGWVYCSNASGADIYLFMQGVTQYPFARTTVMNKWIYLSGDYTVPANTTQIWLRVDNNGNGDVWFDDLRLYPSDAQMTTYTYEPLVGMTSQSDVANHLTSYEYDGLGRLSLTRDQDGNILKMYQYGIQTANPQNGIACNSSNCNGDDEKCINGFCEKAVRINPSTVRIKSGANAGKWKCTYYYQWSNGDTSATFTEYNQFPCDINVTP